MRKELLYAKHTGFFRTAATRTAAAATTTATAIATAAATIATATRERHRGGSIWLIHSLQGGDGMSPHHSGKSKFSKIMPLPFYVVFAAAVKNCNLPLQVPLIWRWRSPAAHLNIHKYRTYRTYFYDFTIFPASFCNSFFRLNSTSPPRAPPPLGAEQLQNEDCLSANRTAEGVRACLMDVFSHTKCLSRTIMQSTPR